MQCSVTIDKCRVSGAFYIVADNIKNYPRIPDNIRRRLKHRNIWAFYTAHFVAQVEDLETGRSKIVSSYVNRMSTRGLKEFANSDYPKAMVLNSLLYQGICDEYIKDEVANEIVEQLRCLKPVSGVIFDFDDIQLWTDENLALHREDGPAFIHGSTKCWCLHGKMLKKSDFHTLESVKKFGAVELFTIEELASLP